MSEPEEICAQPGGDNMTDLETVLIEEIIEALFEGNDCWDEDDYLDCSLSLMSNEPPPFDEFSLDVEGTKDVYDDSPVNKIRYQFNCFDHELTHWNKRLPKQSLLKYIHEKGAYFLLEYLKDSNLFRQAFPNIMETNKLTGSCFIIS